MLSKSEIRRRRKQSLCDKARHREKQQELLRRQEQSQRDKNRRGLFASRSPYTNVMSRNTGLFTRPSSDNPPVNLIPEQVGNKLASILSTYFLNGAYADAEIQVGDATIPIHRLVLCSQSEYFANALEGDFSEGLSKKLTCPPQKEPAYMRMLQYLYTGDYSDEKPGFLNQEDDLGLMKDARVYFLADSFFLTDLKQLSLRKFRSKIAALWAYEELAECITEIYDSTIREDNGILVAVISTVQKHCKELLSSKPFQILLENGREVVFDLVSALSANGSIWY